MDDIAKQLQDEVDTFFQCYDIIPARSSALQNIRILRDKKTTWLGIEENELRIKVDRLLRSVKEPYPLDATTTSTKGII